MNATRLLGICGIAVALAGPRPAPAQVYLQQGNALDANPRVNSGGLNYGPRPYSSSMGNRIVTGNVAGGSSFRGYSPIRDPSSLFFNNYSQTPSSWTGLGSFNPSSFGVQSGLPSDRLTSFNRESVSAGGLRSGYLPGSLNRAPYYSSSSTVANAGAIASGLNRPGSSQLISPYGLARPDARVQPVNPLDAAGAAGNTALSLSPALVRMDNGQPLTGPVNQRLANSRLFGGVREIPLDGLAAQARRDAGGALQPMTVDRRPGSPEDIRRETAEQQRAPGAPDGSKLLGGDAGGLRMPRETGSPADTSDIFGLMRRASGGALTRSLTATPERTTIAQGEAGAGPRLPAGKPSELTDENASGLLRTFVGTRGTALNERLAEAEELLKQGQFYRAADVYSMAQSLDITNPLPSLGRSMSLLAAGDYMSSANALFTAIRLFESLSSFQVDLRAFFTDPSVLESRQTDLMNRLQVFDDFRLRFLLGYLQYSTGRTEVGLAHMEAAAAKSPAEFEAVRRFVAALKAKPHAESAPATQPAGK